MEILKKAEAIVMSEIKPQVEAFYVALKEEVVIRTVCFNGGSQDFQSHKVPLVMVHGFGAGNATFYKIYGQLAKDRPVYGIDLPGFGLSSRVEFSNDAMSCENEMVDLLESWRKKMKLEEIILLGHSFGAYISAAYAIKHSSHMCHLVLLDPWGVLSRQEDYDQQQSGMFEWILRKFSETFKLNPYKMAQRVGPTIGGYLIRMLMKKAAREDYGEDCINYFVQAVTTGIPTGANAFSVLSDHMFVYPKEPLKKRLIKLLKSVHLPITFIYGKKSTFHNKGGQDIKTASKAKCVNIKYIEGGTHHIHVQKPEEVVKIIRNSVFMDHNQVQKTDEASKILCVFDCLTSCEVALSEAKEEEKNKPKNSGKYAIKWDNSTNAAEKECNYWYCLTRHMFIVLVVVLIAITLPGYIYMCV